MKKRSNFIFRLIGLACVVAVLFVYQNKATARAAIIAENEAEIAEVEEYNKEIEKQMNSRGPYANDGDFEGSGQGYGGVITVKVTISDGYIDNVAVTSHANEDPAYYILAEGLVDDIVNTQSADVDTVSGATFSSKGIISAVKEALAKAE